ncbi:hypothetical protein STEG23_007256 [Scotinomys teguina]
MAREAGQGEEEESRARQQGERPKPAMKKTRCRSYREIVTSQLNLEPLEAQKPESTEQSEGLLQSQGTVHDLWGGGGEAASEAQCMAYGEEGAQRHLKQSA